MKILETRNMTSLEVLIDVVDQELYLSSSVVEVLINVQGAVEE